MLLSLTYTVGPCNFSQYFYSFKAQYSFFLDSQLCYMDLRFGLMLNSVDQQILQHIIMPHPHLLAHRIIILWMVSRRRNEPIPMMRLYSQQHQRILQHIGNRYHTNY